MTADEYNELNSLLEEWGWERVTFDGGQDHTMGWTIMSVWELDKAQVTLNYSERYNQTFYEIAANPLALKFLREKNWGHLFEF